MTRPSIGARIRQALRSSHARQAGIVTLGTVLAQVVLIGTTPILSRLYSPEQFGVLGILMSVGTVGGATATLCWQYLILNMKGQAHAAAAFRLTLFTALAGAVLLALGYGAFVTIAPAFALSPDRRLDIALVFAVVFTTAAIGALTYPFARHDRFGPLALSKFNLSALPAIVQIGLGWAGFQAIGLQAGRALGQIMTLAIAAISLPRPFALQSCFRPRRRFLCAIARRNIATVLHTPRVLVVRGLSAAPAAFLFWYYGPAAAGLYFFAERLIERPGLLLADTLSRLPQKNFAEAVRNRRPVMRLVRNYTAAAALAVIPPVLILAFLGTSLFGTLFGARWAEAGAFALPVALNAIFRLVVMPATTMIPVLNRAGRALAYELAFSLRVLAFPVAALTGGDALSAIWAFAGLSALYHAANFGFAIRETLHFEKSLR